MKHFLKATCLLLMAVCAFTACDDDDTYAERRDTERKQIAAFLTKGAVATLEGTNDYLVNCPGPFKVISEETFREKGCVTDTAQNEYVLFKGSGVYMQIVRKGAGKPLEEGESATIINRFVEYNIAGDSVQSTNRVLAYENVPDVMNVQNNYGTFTATFVSGVLYNLYQSSAVPSGWLIPLAYINIGRQDSPEPEIAKVRLIVPSTEGHTSAQSQVYPCFYEISYQKGR